MQTKGSRRRSAGLSPEVRSRLRQVHLPTVDKRILSRLATTFAPWVVLGRELRDLEAAYGIPPEEVRRRLFPADELKLDLPQAARLLEDLPGMENRLKLYHEARKSLASQQESVARDKEAKALEMLIDTLTAQQVALLDLSKRMKIGQGKRKAAPRQWEKLGDITASVYAYLADKVPGQRRKKRGKILLTDPRPYKQHALVLTAELVTLAYQPYLGAGFKLDPRDVRSRLQQRRPAQPAPKHPPNNPSR